MKGFSPVAALLALAALPAMASAEDDVAALRAELQALKSEYVERVQSLETRLEKLETTSEATVDAAAIAAAPSVAPEEPAAANGASSPSAFNPAMSLMLGGTFTNASRDPGGLAHRRLRPCR